MQTNRSIRLIGRTSGTLNATSGAVGEVFYDKSFQTLRLFNGTTVGGEILASRLWVDEQLTTSIDYNNLNNKPTAQSLTALLNLQPVATTGSYASLTGRPALFSGSYNDLTDVPVTPTASTSVLGLVKVDGTTITITNGVISSVATGGGGADISASSINALADVDTVTSAPASNNVLKWNGTNWVPGTVTAADVGLGNVTNQSKATMFASPVFTGTVALPAGSTIGGASIANTGNITFLNNSISTSTGNITIAKLTTFSAGINVTGAIGASINALSDVDTVTVAPTSGQVLKWNGTNWTPAADSTSGGGGSNADTLDGLDSTYFLDYTNLTNKPDFTTLTDVGITNLTVSGIINGLSQATVGLENVTNESKATMFTSPTFTGHPTIEGVTSTGATGTGKLVYDTSPTISNPTFTGTVSGLTVTATQVGLGNVTNESKATMFTNPTFTGTVTGVSKSAVGLGNVENTALSTWPGSTNITTLGTLTSAVLTSNTTGGIGYATGSGGNVTQTGSRTTAVTINKLNGYIQLLSAAGQAAWLSVTVNNSTVAATDNVVVSPATGTNLYIANVSAVAAGSFRFTYYSLVGTAVDSPRFNFAVIKGVAA
jgi:hypothetical protein